MTEILAEQLETEQSMFVQTAQGIESDGAKLTLQGITASTLFFSDRPQRVVGHMATTDFVDLWAIGDNSFETDPPNAVLSFLEPDADAPVDAVVVLTAPNLTGDGNLSYSIDVLEGTVPAHTGPVTLFIDPFGRPLSPVSVCGVRRRERRRDRRGAEHQHDRAAASAVSRTSRKETPMSDTPVLDLLASMTADSLEASSLEPETLMLVRIAALVAVDAAPISYVANLEVVSDLEIDADQVRGVLAAVAPIVGTARIVSALSKIAEALELELEAAEATQEA